MSWKVGWRALRISFGMLLGPGVFPLASFLRLLSNTSREKFSDILELWGPLFSMMNPSWSCHGYLRTAHWHIVGWSVGSSHRGFFY